MANSTDDEYEEFGASSADDITYFTYRDERPVENDMNMSGSNGSRKSLDNSTNLFDDVDDEDKKWLTLAKRYLSHRKYRR